jgi:hypothetical protein
MRGALLVALVLLLGCGGETEVTIEDTTPDVIHTTEHVWHETTVYQTEVIIEEDTTPDVVQITQYEYPSGPVPCLVMTDGGIPAMADGPISALPAATALANADQFVINQSGTSKRITNQEMIPSEAIAGMGEVATQIEANAKSDDQRIITPNKLGLLLPYYYIGGLITSNNGSDALHDIDVAVGNCSSDDNSELMQLEAAITKRIDANWAVGTGNGGLDTGSVASSTLYAVWLIKRPDTGVVDVLFSLSFTSPTLAAGDLPNYTEKRLIGAIKTDGSSDILPYTQRGIYFRYDDSIEDASTAANQVSGTAYDTTVSAPPNSIAHCFYKVTTTGDVSGILLREKGTNDTPTGGIEGNLILPASSGSPWAVKCDALTDASSVVQRLAATSTTYSAILHTLGFTMLAIADPS